jgi:maleylpyruvate isomerase
MTMEWVHDGQRRVEETAASIADVSAPSALPGWTKGHVLTHLSRNADALTNLLTWARTGVESPMYASPAARNADIEAGAGRPLPAQLADLRESASRFSVAVAKVPDWEVLVRTAQGREVPVSEVPWMRVREVWLHLIDLNAGAGPDDLPDDVGMALVRDVAAWMAPKLDTPVELLPTGHAPLRLGQAGPVSATVAGPANRLAAWLTGRTDLAGVTTTGEVPTLPKWL